MNGNRAVRDCRDTLVRIVSKVVEAREVERDYGFTGNEVIVDHPKLGRLLVTDGFGGDPQGPNGMCVRWRHGVVVKLKPDDTFEILDGDWNEWLSILGAVLDGRDDERPIQLWDGPAIAGFMNKLGYPGN